MCSFRHRRSSTSLHLLRAVDHRLTSDTEREVGGQANRRITLFDIEKLLFDIWVKRYAEIEDSRRGLLPLRPVYFVAPRE